MIEIIFWLTNFDLVFVIWNCGGDILFLFQLDLFFYSFLNLLFSSLLHLELFRLSHHLFYIILILDIGKYTGFLYSLYFAASITFLLHCTKHLPPLSLLHIILLFHNPPLYIIQLSFSLGYKRIHIRFTQLLLMFFEHLLFRQNAYLRRVIGSAEGEVGGHDVVLAFFYQGVETCCGTGVEGGL